MSNIGINIWAVGDALQEPEVQGFFTLAENTPVEAGRLAVAGGDYKYYGGAVGFPINSQGEGISHKLIEGGVKAFFNIHGSSYTHPTGFGGPSFSIGVYGESEDRFVASGGMYGLIGVQIAGEGYTWNAGKIDLSFARLNLLGSDYSLTTGGAELGPIQVTGSLFTHKPMVWIFFDAPKISIFNKVAYPMPDRVEAEVDTTTELLTVVAEIVRASSQASILSEFLVDISEEVVARAIELIPVYASIAESLEAGAEQELTAFKLVRAMEVLSAEADFDTKAALIVGVAAYLGLRDFTSLASQLTVEDSLRVLASNDSILKKGLAVLESIEALMESTTNAFLAIETGEDVAVVDEPITQARLQALIEEGAAVFVSIKVGDEDYSGWVMQTATFGFSEYTNFPFNDLVSVGGRYFGVASDGLYELEGDTDDGAAIDAHIRTGLLDMGSHFLKDAKAAYIGYNSKGEVFLKVATTMKGQKEEWWYRLKQGPAQSLRDGRVTIGRGLRAKYWQFEVANLEGADFDLDDIHIMYNVLSRRIR